MTLEEIRHHCLGKPGVTEDIKWEHNLCFCVSEKLFALTNPDSYPVSAAFKVTDENFEELTDREGFRQAPYFAKHQWVYVDDINRLTAKEGRALLDEAYDMIFAKLPARTRKALSGKKK
jgi:predicted DNA-binding protein (MmcQ/YjbR family)